MVERFNFNRTLKERIIHGRTYHDRDELAAARSSFVELYNLQPRMAS